MPSNGIRSAEINLIFLQCQEHSDMMVTRILLYKHYWYPIGRCSFWIFSGLHLLWHLNWLTRLYGTNNLEMFLGHPWFLTPFNKASHKLVAAKFVWKDRSKQVWEWVKACVSFHLSNVQRQARAPLKSFKFLIDVLSTPMRIYLTLFLCLKDSPPSSLLWIGLPLTCTVLLVDMTIYSCAGAVIADWITRFYVPIIHTSSDRGSQFYFEL